MENKKRKLEEITNADAGTPTPKKMVKSEGGGSVMPINGISPYISGRWRIGGTATGIEPLREINSKKGPIKVFSFLLTDKAGQSIKMTAFAKTAEKFHPQLEENGTFYVSGAQSCIRAANQRYNSTGHDYEVTLSHDSMLAMPEQQTYEAPKFVLRKTTLDQLSIRAGQSVDILAVIDKIEEAVTIKKKDNTETVCRNVQLIDQSATSVTLTLWGDQAQGFNGETGRVIGIKNAFVREYNGTYSISVNSGCRIEIDPASAETQELYEWFEGERPTIEVKSISFQAVDELRLFSFFSNQNLSVDLQREIYFNNISVITQIRSDDALYKSCEQNDCSKKVTESNGIWQCGANHHSNGFKYRFMVSMELTDICESTWVTLFNDKAESFFGKTATEMIQLQESNNDAYKAVFDAKMFTIHNFRCGGEYETYNDVHRLKYQVYEIQQPNYEQYDMALDAVMKQLEVL